MIKVIGQPWCGESVRIVKLSHLGLVEVPHNPVHVILTIIQIIIQIQIMIINNDNGWGHAQSSSRNPERRVFFPSKIPTGFSALLLPFPAMCSLGRACKLLNISEHLSNDQVFEHWPDMRAVLGSAEEAPVKVVLSKETLFVAVVRLSPQLSDCLRLQHHLETFTWQH